MSAEDSTAKAADPEMDPDVDKNINNDSGNS